MSTLTPRQQFREAIETLPNSRRREAWKAWNKEQAIKQEMLEALKQLYALFNEYTDLPGDFDTEFVRAAIAKAEGRDQ